MLARILSFFIIFAILIVAFVGGIAVSVYDFLRHLTVKRVGITAGVVLAAVIVFTGVYTWNFNQRDVPEVFDDIDDHFKYGSIGGETIPYWIWLVLPDLFPEYLPDRAGEGYARMGFNSELDSPKGLPIGLSYRDRPIPVVGPNCAACHSGVVRESPEAEQQIVLGMPANRFALQEFIEFLIDVGEDERFNADTLIPAIQNRNPDFSFLDRLLYRFIVVPRMKKALSNTAERFSWMSLFPRSGPGRTDTFNPYKEVYGVGELTETGVADLPSLWNQRVRDGMNLHWDGDNSSLAERNLNAAIGAANIPDDPINVLDFGGITRVADWIADFGPPDFPRERIDASLAEAGVAVYQTYCAVCHALNGELVGQVTPIEEVGTDPNRLNSFTQELADRLNKTFADTRYAYKNYRKTNGYANMPLDGIWLRGPYLHNGSVPTLRDLLKPPEQRPKVFNRGYDVLDYDNVGFVSSGPESEPPFGFTFDTTLPGNGNQGHLYGTQLSPADKETLLEYLKTE